ncbi:MAG: HAMP domain-containing histidine kinase [Chloroflexi bacterium]|nr:HAMP domain-containing histidine kinase [Chloroflexota bacterium]
MWLIATGLALAGLLLLLPHELDQPAYRPLLPWAQIVGWTMATSALGLLLSRTLPARLWPLAWPARLLGALGAGTAGLALLPAARAEGAGFLLFAAGVLVGGQRRRLGFEVWGGLVLGAVALCALEDPSCPIWLVPVGLAGGGALAGAAWRPQQRAWLCAAAVVGALLIAFVLAVPARWLGGVLALGVASAALATALAPLLPSSQLYSRLLRGSTIAAALPLVLLGAPIILAVHATEEQEAHSRLRSEAELAAAFVSDNAARAALSLATHAALPHDTSEELAAILGYAGPPARLRALWLHDAVGALRATTTTEPLSAPLPALPGALPGGVAVSPLGAAGAPELAVVSRALPDGRRLSASVDLSLPSLEATGGAAGGVSLRNGDPAETRAAGPAVVDDGVRRWLVVEHAVAGTPWVVRAHEPLRLAYRNVTLTTVLGATLWFAAILLLAAVGAVLMQSITGPLRVLEGAFAALARGEGKRVAIRTGDELERLGQAFDALSGELGRSRAALTELNRTLEERIHERTAELEAAQAQLERYAADIHAAYRAERARSREVEEFVYAVSHDLKAPLVSIQSYSAALARGDLDAETQTRYLERLSRNAEHMERLMQALLELARAGTMSEPRVPVDTYAMVRNLCEAHAQPEQQPITFVVSPTLPMVRAERGRLERVFANLIDNAVKYRGAQAAPRVEIGAEPNGATWRFWVCDNGLGIPAQVQGRLFRPFFRAPERQDVPGSGMGLALVQKIVRAHGGEVWVESGEGRGTTVSFTLPRSPDDGAHGAHAAPGERAATPEPVAAATHEDPPA